LKAEHCNPARRASRLVRRSDEGSAGDDRKSLLRGPIAAVMECLDLVITSDTAIAHLASATIGGRPSSG